MKNKVIKDVNKHHELTKLMSTESIANPNNASSTRGE